MNDRQNLSFAADPRRVAAKKELDCVVRHIRADVMMDGSALYYLTVLPPLVKKLEAAYMELKQIEERIIQEMEVREK